jgi:hypothetical protein
LCSRTEKCIALLSCLSVARVSLSLRRRGSRRFCLGEDDAKRKFPSSCAFTASQLPASAIKYPATRSWKHFRLICIRNRQSAVCVLDYDSACLHAFNNIAIAFALAALAVFVAVVKAPRTSLVIADFFPPSNDVDIDL